MARSVLRSALQFSLNIPAIKATIMSGLDHVFERTKEFGLTYPKTAVPVLSEGIGTLEVHPIDLLGAYGTIANGGVLMPRRVISTILDSDGQTVWPTPETTPKGNARRRAPGPPTSSPTSWPATPTRRSTRSGASGRSTTARRAARPPTRPARPATTATWRRTASSPRRPTRRRRRSPSVVWMGNSDNTPNDGKLSLDTSAPLWSAILTEVSKGEKIAKFKPPSQGLVTATVDAFTGLKPGPFSTKTVSECFLPGTVPTQKETVRKAASIDAASGLLWRDGCAGPKVTKGFFNLSEVESNFPNWQKANANWGARAARGSGVGGGPKGTRTAYFYNGAFAPFGRSWGAPFAPDQAVPAVHAPPPVLRPVRRHRTRSRPTASCIPRFPTGGGVPVPASRPKPKPTVKH